MNSSKIKKHFSLFMVKKSINKKSNEPDGKKLLQEIRQCCSQTIQKFIDPIPCYHYGDIYLIDKHSKQDIGLLSINNYFKSITNLKQDAEYKCWIVSLLTINHSLDCWSLVYDRLMSLGDQKAYNLAQTIDSIYISNKKCKKLEDQRRPNLNYLEEVEKMFQMKKKSIYFACKYQRSTVQKGLELKNLIFSKELVELAFANEQAFIEHLLKYGLFDFLTIEAENYFEAINNKLKCVVNAESNCVMEVKFQTIDGHSFHVTPLMTTKIQMNEKAETIELILFMEFKPKEDFFRLVENKREEKTKPRKKKTNREINLENVLNIYYNTDEFKTNDPNVLTENLKAIKYEKNHNTCGYRIIDS